MPVVPDLSDDHLKQLMAGTLDVVKRRLFDVVKPDRQAISALAAMTGLKIATLDRLVSGDRHDLLLILGRTIGLEWHTVHALIQLRLGPKRVPAQRDIEAIKLAYARLASSTAERVVAFWQTRH